MRGLPADDEEGYEESVDGLLRRKGGPFSIRVFKRHDFIRRDVYDGARTMMPRTPNKTRELTSHEVSNRNVGSNRVSTPISELSLTILTQKF